MKIKYLLILVSLVCLGLGFQTIDKNYKKTVSFLDVKRYMGTWYEIGRFDHSFEKGLERVTATYTLLKDGKIQVINKGYKRTSGSSKVSIAEGKAYQPDPKEPGKLKISFFLWFYSDYYILELDKAYQYALIGEKSGRYFWILSRTPQIEKDDLRHLLDCAKRRGYDTNKILWVKQK